LVVSSADRIGVERHVDDGADHLADAAGVRFAHTVGGGGGHVLFLAFLGR
jgi:hypothetical protein